jgi:hypothetical protein
VVLQAQNDITVTDAISLTTTPNANLTLQAGRSIAINNSVATNGSGNITMVANNTDNSETNAASGALVGSGGTNRSAGAASLTVSGAISTGAGGAIKLVNSSASTLGGETGGVTVNSAITTGKLHRVGRGQRRDHHRRRNHDHAESGWQPDHGQCHGGEHGRCRYGRQRCHQPDGGNRDQRGRHGDHGQRDGR